MRCGEEAEPARLWCVPEPSPELSERVSKLAQRLGVAETLLRAGLAYLHVTEAVDRLELAAKRLRRIVGGLEAVLDELAQVVAAGRREGGRLV